MIPCVVTAEALDHERDALAGDPQAVEPCLEDAGVGLVGHDEVDVIEERGAAIRHAVAAAAAADVIVIAGKGHEDYQEIAGTKLPFSDLDEARRALEARA